MSSLQHICNRRQSDHEDGDIVLQHAAQTVILIVPATARKRAEEKKKRAIIVRKRIKNGLGSK